MTDDGGSSTAGTGTSWSWDDVLAKYTDDELKASGHPGAAPVSAFKLQKVPLYQQWDVMSAIGTVGEIDLNSKLASSISYLNVNGKRQHNCGKESPKYWIVEVVKLQGYVAKVRFLGYASSQHAELMKYDRWIHISQLKQIGFYRKNGGILDLPQIPIRPNLNSKAMMDHIFEQMIGKPTLNSESLKSAMRTTAHSRFKIGSKVEVMNRDCCTEMRLAIVSKTCGRRLKCMYLTNPGDLTNDFIWIHEDSDLIQLPGWAKTVGGKLVDDTTTRNYDPVPLELNKLGVKVLPNSIKLGMLFEFINPIRLDQIAVGKVSKVLHHGYFCGQIISELSEEDVACYLKGSNEFHFHISSDQLFPLGTFISETPAPIPWDNATYDNENFEWGAYMQTHGLEALELPPKNHDEIPCSFEELMWVEAVDSHRPELVCPAIILKVKYPYAVKVRFLGWEAVFDQWKVLSSQEIFPIGWCQMTGYPLETPKAFNFEVGPAAN